MNRAVGWLVPILMASVTFVAAIAQEPKIEGFFFDAVPAVAGKDARVSGIIVDLYKAGAALPVQTGVLALVDTGATESAVDEDLAVSLGLPVIDQVQGLAGGFRVQLTRYDCRIGFPELKRIKSVECVGSPMKKNGDAFSIILGMNMLRYFNLSMKAREGGVTLYPAWPEPAN
jgi:hypothetical protein